MADDRLGHDPLCDESPAVLALAAEVEAVAAEHGRRARRRALYRGAGERRARRVRALVRQLEQHERALRGALDSMGEVMRQIVREAERLDVDEDPDGGGDETDRG